MTGGAVEHVVKLGGSLLDFPDLVQRFQAWRRTELQSSALLLVGGGEAADAVRDFDRVFHLDEAAAHWLAIRAMQLNAHLAAAVLPQCALVEDLGGCRDAWARGRLPIVDPLPWLGREDQSGVTIPHRWSFTSDSIAAHLAVRLRAERLTLLKSALPLQECGPVCAAGLGIVDADFPEACAPVTRIELVNLRPDPPQRCTLR